MIAHYKGGRKYDADNNYQIYEKGTGDPKKAESAAIFFKKWKEAESHSIYSLMKKNWKEKYG